ncbi:hypothetical protein L3X38_031508 [Prunus dulcis]|uniref:Uncharacterized protein n=1 Tax=Prunus dulcis TaxID=3755 RepID=A0AAD4VDE9_PRUDU|nr:hypothetical protein L3X38_031508 [Prunus dulcis]
MRNRNREESTCPDNPIAGKPGQLPGHVGQDVDRVRQDQQDLVVRVLGEPRDNIAEEADVSVEQVEPGLAEDLAGPSGDDVELRSDCDGVVDVGYDLGAGEEGGGVLEVEHLVAELLRFGVDEDELVGEVLGEDGLGDGHNHIAGMAPITENLVRRLVGEGEAAPEMGLKKA